jgi:hypothetical protein
LEVAKNALQALFNINGNDLEKAWTMEMFNRKGGGDGDKSTVQTLHELLAMNQSMKAVYEDINIETNKSLAVPKFAVRLTIEPHVFECGMCSSLF